MCASNSRSKIACPVGKGENSVTEEFGSIVPSTWIISPRRYSIGPYTSLVHDQDLTWLKIHGMDGSEGVDCVGLHCFGHLASVANSTFLRAESGLFHDGGGLRLAHLTTE